MRRSTVKKKAKVSGTKAKPRKRVSHRTGKINGIGDIGGIAKKVAGLGVGAIAARELSTLIQKTGIVQSPMIIGAIQVGVGILLPMLVKGNSFVEDMGDGAAAFGVQVLAVSTGIITGPNDRVSYRINGPGNFNVIAGAQNGAGLSVIAGPQRRRMGNAPRNVATKQYIF